MVLMEKSEERKKKYSNWLAFVTKSVTKYQYIKILNMSCVCVSVCVCNRSGKFWGGLQ